LSSAQIATLFALCANLCFSISTIYFSILSKKNGTLWINSLKTGIAFICFAALFLISPSDIFVQASLFFFFSGIIGLGIGDIFLIKAFEELGPSRTLILFSFQPIVFLIVDSFLLNIHLSSANIISVSLFILCILLFSRESINQNKDWNLKGIYIALTGIFLDGTGLFLTKKGFIATRLDGVSANFIRCFGAVLVYFLISRFRPIQLREKFLALDPDLRKKAIIFSFTGAFLSLFLYLNAIKLGALSVVTAISVTGPIFTTIFESIILKRPPTKTLYFCLILFLSAFLINNL